MHYSISIYYKQLFSQNFNCIRCSESYFICFYRLFEALDVFFLHILFFSFTFFLGLDGIDQPNNEYHCNWHIVSHWKRYHKFVSRNTQSKFNVQKFIHTPNIVHRAHCTPNAWINFTEINITETKKIPLIAGNILCWFISSEEMHCNAGK